MIDINAIFKDRNFLDCGCYWILSIAFPRQLYMLPLYTPYLYVYIAAGIEYFLRIVDVLKNVLACSMH